jgi:hypothetical protein
MSFEEKENHGDKSQNVEDDRDFDFKHLLKCKEQQALALQETHEAYVNAVTTMRKVSEDPIMLQAMVSGMIWPSIQKLSLYVFRGNVFADLELREKEEAAYFAYFKEVDNGRIAGMRSSHWLGSVFFAYGNNIPSEDISAIESYDLNVDLVLRYSLISEFIIRPDNGYFLAIPPDFCALNERSADT